MAPSLASRTDQHLRWSPLKRLITSENEPEITVLLGDRIQSMTPEICVTAETAPTQGRAPLHLIAYGDSPPGTPAANAAKRLVAAEADLLGGKRSDLIPLGNALVANRLLTRGTGTLEVAHEALLRRPPLDGWLC